MDDRSITVEARQDNPTAPSGAPTREYALGHSATELERLKAQAAMLEPFTVRLLHDAGIRPGMRVLDAGCGSGDVTMLAAAAVGPSGRVVALDRAPAAVEATRARSASLPNVETVLGEADTIGFDAPFDAVVGRFVLMYCPDPAATLRHLAAQVRPGGLVMFQEYDLQVCRSSPPAPLFDENLRLIVETLDRVGTHIDMGLSMYSAYVAAGLPAPSMRYEAAIGGGHDFAGFQVAAQVTASMLPTIERLGLGTAAELEVETLADRMRDEVVAAGGVVTFPPLVGAYAAKPEGG